MVEVTATFDKPRYRPLTGSVANCNRSGEGPGLDGRGPGWGDLAGDGVTIGAHQTNPSDFDRAQVPGARGDVIGDITDDGAGVGGVRVVLVAEGARCPIVAEATTDDAGHFELRRVPVGNYQVFVFPPAGWQSGVARRRRAAG